MMDQKELDMVEVERLLHSTFIEALKGWLAAHQPTKPFTEDDIRFLDTLLNYVITVSNKVDHIRRSE